MSAVAAPERSREQRLTALKRANNIRKARAALKIALRDRDIDAASVIENPHPDYLTMKVAELLDAIPKYGPNKVRKTLARVKVSGSKTLGGLSDRQRLALAAVLRGQPVAEVRARRVGSSSSLGVRDTTPVESRRPALQARGRDDYYELHSIPPELRP